MYEYLNGRLQQMGIRQAELGDMLGMCSASVSHRFTGRTPWTIDEMYKIMDICQAPAEQLHVYFPPKRHHFTEASHSKAEGLPIVVTIKIEQSGAINPQISCSLQQI